jgi:hypothetical protein
LILTSVQLNSFIVNPVEFQVFSSSNSTAGAVTVHSPQLQISIVPLSDAGSAQIRFTKIAMFASYDPKQRPV